MFICVSISRNLDVTNMNNCSSVFFTRMFVIMKIFKYSVAVVVTMVPELGMLAPAAVSSGQYLETNWMHFPLELGPWVSCLHSSPS